MPIIGKDALTDHSASHEDGGSDEITVQALSGALADAQTPAAHKTSHENGGADEISVAGLSGALADAQTPAAHKTSHENGGADEISVAGLSGVLADPQTPIGSLIGEGFIAILIWVYSSVTQGSWSFVVNANQALNFLFRNDSNAQNDQVNYKVFLAAGTYTFSFLGYIDPNQAILTLLIDDVSVGTIDLYSAGSAFNATAAVSGIVISSAGLKTISIKAATRNASSTGWYLTMSNCAFFRTA